MKFRLFLLVLIALLLPQPALQAACTFSNAVVSRDSTGKNLTANPSLSECDVLGNSITLQIFSLAPNFTWAAQVTYISGPTTIAVNGSTVRAGSVVAATGFSHQAHVTLGFVTYGDYTFMASAPGGPIAQSKTVTIRVSPFQIKQTLLFVATGGTSSDMSSISVNTNLSGSLTFTKSLVSNDKGKSVADLSFALSGSSANVAALNQGGSGVFSVVAKKTIFTSSNSARVIVPPQPLIQVLIGEAQGQSDSVQGAVASVIKNRTNSSLRFGEAQKNYTDEIVARGQFASISTSRFAHALLRQTADSQPAYDTALSNAGRVFGGTGALNLGGAVAFGSPGAVSGGTLEVKKIRDALGTCPRKSASTLGFSTLWFPQLGIDSQLLVVSSIDPGVMVFVRQRPTPSDCAVIAIGLN